MTGIDPLLNHLILETIFKNLRDAPDLKSVRLVSPLWKKASLEPWRRTGVLVISPDGGGGGSSSSSTRSAHLLTLSKFRRMSKTEGDLGRKPFSNYKLVGWRFHPEESKSELRFFREHGSSIKYLHLDHCTFSSFSDLEDLLSRRLPNLEKLVWSVKEDPREDFEEYDEDDWHELVGVRDENGAFVEEVELIFPVLKTRHDSRVDFQRSCKVLEIRRALGAAKDIETPWKVWPMQTEFWTKLFYCMPAVQDVRLQMNESEYYRFSYVGASLYGVVDGLKLVTRLHGGSNIRKLDIMDFFERANCQFGGEALTDHEKVFDLALLEELSMDWGTGSGEACSKNVLRGVSDTLQVLKAFRAPRKARGFVPTAPLPLPGQMTALRELHLHGNVTENLTFLRFTPNLEVLVMNQYCFEQRHKWGEEARMSLRFCKDDLVFNTERTLRLQRISEPSLILPSLQHLEVDYPVNAERVPTLARWLPNVKTVKMVMDNNELLAASCKVWPKLEEIECLYTSKVDDAGVSSLMQCSELRKFKMNAVCGQATLTSSSADTFLKIGSLRELDICTSEQVNVDKEAQLMSKLRAVKLQRSDHSIDDNLEYECCQWKRFLLKIGVVKLPPKVREKSPAVPPRALRSGRVVRSRALRSGRTAAEPRTGK